MTVTTCADHHGNAKANCTASPFVRLPTSSKWGALKVKYALAAGGRYSQPGKRIQGSSLEGAKLTLAKIFITTATLSLIMHEWTDINMGPTTLFPFSDMENSNLYVFL